MTSLVYGANKKHEGNRSTRNLSVAFSPEQQKKGGSHFDCVNHLRGRKENAVKTLITVSLNRYIFQWKDISSKAAYKDYTRVLESPGKCFQYKLSEIFFMKSINMLMEELYEY